HSDRLTRLEVNSGPSWQHRSRTTFRIRRTTHAAKNEVEASNSFPSTRSWPNVAGDQSNWVAAHEWRVILAKLSRASLLGREDPNNPGHLDTHPLVREFFGEQLRNERREAWKESNRRLYYYYQALAPQLPDKLGEMEPLLLAVICGCNAGQFREALHDVYIPRIQRGNTFFAANVLGARGALLSVLAHFLDSKAGAHRWRWAQKGRISCRKTSFSS
ncbi:MAG: hypothetical protein WBL39_21410, partial [Terrimicrobiaceae bacterium]